MTGPRLKRDGRRGTAAVEFALVLPLFVVILFGVIEYGWVFYQTFSVASAVRDGLRTGATVPMTASPDSLATALQSTKDRLAGVGITPSAVTLNAQYKDVWPSKTLWLSATMPYKPLLGFVPVPTDISYEMRMILEQQ
jgi:Flp pilus assembly protein TadG